MQILVARKKNSCEKFEFLTVKLRETILFSQLEKEWIGPFFSRNETFLAKKAGPNTGAARSVFFWMNSLRIISSDSIHLIQPFTWKWLENDLAPLRHQHVINQIKTEFILTFPKISLLTESRCEICFSSNAPSKNHTTAAFFFLVTIFVSRNENWHRKHRFRMIRHIQISDQPKVKSSSGSKNSSTKSSFPKCHRFDWPIRRWLARSYEEISHIKQREC